MEHFSYKSGYGICVSRHLKEELAWDIDQQFHIIVILFKVISYTTKELKSKVVLTFKAILYALLCAI